jgi:hypothetical protein
MLRLAIALAAPALAGCTAAQEQPRPGLVAPAANDLTAINAALDGVYAVISGPVGQPRDFARMKTLFTPDARLTAIGSRGLSGGTVDDYVARSGSFLVSGGFTEKALVNRIEVYGDLAHAWSSYEGFFTNPDGTAGKVRGINSFQLVRQTDGRWLVQSIFWQAEAPDRPLPADMEPDMSRGK